jgi:hypothetical protein
MAGINAIISPFDEETFYATLCRKLCSKYKALVNENKAGKLNQLNGFPWQMVSMLPRT